MKKDETPDWQGVGLPSDFLIKVTRRRNIKDQIKLLEKVAEELDDYITIQLKLVDQKSVKVDDLGTIGLRTNTNVKIDGKLLLKAGVTVSQIEAATVRTESKEYVQLYPKKARKEESDEE